MSKRPKKSRHRVPPQAIGLRSDPIDDRYWTEVEMSTTRLERRYRKTQKALQQAEAKAQRIAEQIAALETKQREAVCIAQRRAEEEKRALGYIQRIKEAAQRQRVGSARTTLERKHREAVERRREQVEQRQAEAKAAREHDRLLIARRREHDALLLIVEDRRRELREIERLMQVEGYGRDSRRRIARHEAGAITIPLGATSGHRPKRTPTRAFPVTVRSKDDPQR